MTHRRTAAIAMFAALIGGGSAAYRLSPLVGDSASASSWKLDTSRSDQFNSFNKWKWMNGFFDVESCTPADQTAKRCTPAWHGQAPALIRPDAAYTASGVLTLKMEQTDESFADEFAVANAAVAAADGDEGCGCEYDGVQTGLVKSRKLNRGGIIEVRMQTPGVPDVLSNVWLQGANLELSAVSIHGQTLKTGGYVFDGSGTVSQAEVSTELPGAPDTGFAVYSIEWRLNNDVVISVNGTELHALHGADWNPTDAHNTELLNLMIDLQLDPAAADPWAAVGAGSPKLLVDDVHFWELDCATQMQFAFGKPAKGGSATHMGLVGVAPEQVTGACAAADFGKHCSEPVARPGLCLNPFPAQAALTTPGQMGACDLINNAAYCGGWLDNRGTHIGGDDPSKAFGANAGSMGHCTWDPTAARDKSPEQIAALGQPHASKTGACVPAVPAHINLGSYTDFSKLQQCGGTNDKTEGFGMWCFDQCVQRTEFNPVGTPYWKNFCGGAVNNAGEDICTTMGQVGSVIESGTWKASYSNCMKASDTTAANKRSKHCYMTWQTASEASDLGAWAEGRAGMYCKSRDPSATTGPSKIPLWMMSAFGQDKCEAGGGTWTCEVFPDKSDSSVCQRRNRCRTAQAAENKAATRIDNAYCDASDAKDKLAANCATPPMGAGTRLDRLRTRA